MKLLPPISSRFLRRAFTLVELLVVISIVALLMALVVPAFKNIGAANLLTSAGSLVMNELNAARQTALVQSQQVELRIYKLPGIGGQPSGYRALQRIRVHDGAPLDTVVYLPNAIIFTDEEKFSTLLSGANNFPEAPKNRAELPGHGTVEFKAIRYTASGSTNLAPEGAKSGQDRWFLTLKHASSREDASGRKPAENFMTIQVNPVSGRTRLFQP